MKKRMTKAMNEEFKNLDSVVDGDIDATVAISPELADAIEQEKKLDDHLGEVSETLAKNAEAIKMDNPEAPEVKSKNIYTKKLILDESMHDFDVDSRNLLDIDWSSDERKLIDREENAGGEDGDHYLDFNMQDFMDRLFTHTGGASDMVPKYPDGIDVREYDLGVDGDKMELYANSEEYFDSAIAACALYQLEHGPVRRISPIGSANPRYAMRVTIPMISEDIPMLMPDYFEDIGMDLNVPMSDKWVDTYNKKIAKIEKEQDAALEDSEVDKIIRDAVENTLNDDRDFEDHLKDLLKKLKNKKLKFNSSNVKAKFWDMV